MRIDVWHNLLWPRYKGEVFSELYKLGEASENKLKFYQIAETGTDRQSLARVDLSFHKYPFQLMFSGAYEEIPLIKLIVSLTRAVAETDADLVIIAGYSRIEYWVQILCLRITKKKIGVFCDSTAIDRPYRYYKYVLKGILFRRCDIIFCYGERSVEYVKSFGVDPERITTQCQAAATLCNIAIDELVGRRRHAAAMTKIILFVGRLAREKNLDRLIEAFALVLRIHPKTILRLVGDGPDRESLCRRVQERNLSENVIFVGGKDPLDLGDEYISAACLALPSLSEPWGLVVNEALSFGCPVVVSEKCGCAPELVHVSKTGFVVDPFDVLDIAKKLSRALEEFTDIDTCTRTCVGVVARFTPRAAASQILSGCMKALSFRGRSNTKYKLDTVTRRLSPEARTRGMNLLVRVAPGPALRLMERVFDLPIPDIVRESPSLFIHIPKNAGTTVSMALYGRFIGHRSALWYRRANRKLFDTKHKFAILRDPVDRFISAFYFLQAGGTDLVPASQAATKLIRRFGSIVEFIDGVESGRVKKFKEIDLVFHDQSRYVTNEKGHIIVDDIFVLEQVAGGKLCIPGAAIDMKTIVNKSKKPSIVNDYDMIRWFVLKQYESDCKLLAKYSK